MESRSATSHPATRRGSLLLLALALGITACASQSVGPGGVHQRAPGAEQRVGPGGVSQHAGGAEQRVSPTCVEQRAGGAHQKVGLCDGPVPQVQQSAGAPPPPPQRCALDCGGHPIATGCSVGEIAVCRCEPTPLASCRPAGS